MEAANPLAEVLFACSFLIISCVGGVHPQPRRRSAVHVCCTGQTLAADGSQSTFLALPVQ